MSLRQNKAQMMKLCCSSYLIAAVLKGMFGNEDVFLLLNAWCLDSSLLAS